MLFNNRRMKYTTTYQGKTDPNGWIVLDLAGAEIDGVTKLYLSVADIEALRKKGDVAGDKLKEARSLLGYFGADTDDHTNP